MGAQVFSVAAKGFKVLSGLLIVFLLTVSFQARLASFDCAKANGQMEKSICSDFILSKLDDRLGTVYSNLRSNLTDGHLEKPLIMSDFGKIRALEF